MTAAPGQPTPDWPTLSADLDQLVHDWPTLTEEQRIEKGVAMAMAIVRPEDWRGYVIDQSRPHRWQHVEACRGAITGALRRVAAPAKELEELLAPAAGGGKEHRIRTVRKELAAMMLGDIMSDFGNRPPTRTTMKNGGELSWLVTIAYAVASGRIGKHPNQDAMVRKAVLRYAKEVWDWQWKVPRVRKYKELKRSRSGPPAWLREAIDNPEGRQKLEEEWFCQRPDSDA